MEFSLRTIRQYQKLAKAKRSLHQSISPDQESDGLMTNSTPNSVFTGPETIELKHYHDSHLFKTNLTPTEHSAEFSRRPTISREKTQMEAYQGLSKRRDIRRLHNTSYQLQKTQKSQKTQRAHEDLMKIGSISINTFERNPENFVRFNKEIQTVQKKEKEEQPFRRWRTLTREKSRKSRSPTKGKMSVGKRAKNSPNKASFNLRIRKTFNNSKTSDMALNLSTIESSNVSIENLKPSRRKSSITPWETEQEGFY